MRNINAKYGKFIMPYMASVLAPDKNEYIHFCAINYLTMVKILSNKHEETCQMAKKKLACNQQLLYR